MFQLYGGAVTTELPVGIIDVSDLRPVPDNQEVFIIEDGDKDISVIFDLLVQVPAQEIGIALRMHIDDMLDARQYTMVEEVDLKFLNTKVHICYVKFTHSMHLISLIRLDRAKTDVLISMHVHESDVNVVMEKYYDIFKAAGVNYNVTNWDLFT